MQENSGLNFSFPTKKITSHCDLRFWCTEVWYKREPQIDSRVSAVWQVESYEEESNTYTIRDGGHLRTSMFLRSSQTGAQRSSSGPSGPKLENGVENEFPWPSNPGVQEVKIRVETESRKKILSFHFFDSLFDSHLTFRIPGPKALGINCQLCFQLWA